MKYLLMIFAMRIQAQRYTRRSSKRRASGRFSTTRKKNGFFALLGVSPGAAIRVIALGVLSLLLLAACGVFTVNLIEKMDEPEIADSFVYVYLDNTDRDKTESYRMAAIDRYLNQTLVQSLEAGDRLKIAKASGAVHPPMEIMLDEVVPRKGKVTDHLFSSPDVDDEKREAFLQRYKNAIELAQPPGTLKNSAIVQSIHDLLAPHSGGNGEGQAISLHIASDFLQHTPQSMTIYGSSKRKQYLENSYAQRELERLVLPMHGVDVEVTLFVIQRPYEKDRAGHDIGSRQSAAVDFFVDYLNKCGISNIKIVKN